MNQLEQLLKAHKYRRTKPREAVFELLNDTAAPLSLTQIRKSLPGLERTSLYRTLDLFERLDVITIIHVGWKKRYELADPFKPHHHHLVCTTCQKVTAVHPPELEQLIAQLSNKHGFAAQNHHFEIRGVCHKCQKVKNKIG